MECRSFLIDYFKCFIVEMAYIILDLEATCWNPNSVQYEQEIIEIGAVFLDPFLTPVKQFSKLVKPIKHAQLSLYCKQLTGIQQIEVERAKSFEFVIESFLEWSLLHENNSVLYTWGSKDSKLIRENCRSHRIECDWIESLVDLKPQYAKIRNFAKPVGLDKALKIEEIEFEGGRHRALPDAANLAKLFIKLFEYWEK